MKITDFERGDRSPVEFFPGLTRAKKTPVKRKPSRANEHRLRSTLPIEKCPEGEIETRRRLARKAYSKAGTRHGMAEILKVSKSTIDRWLSTEHVIADDYLEIVAALAEGGDA